MAGVQSSRSAGRPRDASIDERVLSVTRELLVEVGWDALSMRLIAARCGVSRSSLDRRWSSKAELVLHAILGATPILRRSRVRIGWAGWIGWCAAVSNFRPSRGESRRSGTLARDGRER